MRKWLQGRFGLDFQTPKALPFHAFLTYNKSAADNFENMYTNIRKISLNKDTNSDFELETLLQKGILLIHLFATKFSKSRQH